MATTKNWPQAGGPNGNWKASGPAPTHWSVTHGVNIRWRTMLPETGQSGIAVWGDRLFLTTMAPLARSNTERMGATISLYCLSATTGKILWTATLRGTEPSPYSYSFSDSSTPTPVTDGVHVWFTNSSGAIACYTIAGELRWTTTWKPTTVRPFNKQFEPILYQNQLLSIGPRDEGDPKREKDPWNYLRGLDAATGKTLWIAEDGLTHYNTPIFGFFRGKPCVLQGRGGHHDVPEAPIGLSLTSLAPGEAGKTLWRTTLTGKALYNMHWDAHYAYWLNEDESTHTVLDIQTGKVLRTHLLQDKADWRRYDPLARRYVLESGVSLKERGGRVFPGWFTNVVVGGWHYFLCFSNPKPAYGLGPVGPLYCVGRVHVESGKVEYLEVPTAPGVWGKELPSSTINARGVDCAQDPRSKRDGWHWCFIGSPTVINQKIYWTMMNGTSYVIDGTVSLFDERAIVAVNDLGPTDRTWSLNSISTANGKLFHRSMKEVLCFG